MKYIEKQELLERLEEVFEDLEDESGCTVMKSDGSWEFLSIARIVEVIEECETYDDED